MKTRQLVKAAAATTSILNSVNSEAMAVNDLATEVFHPDVHLAEEKSIHMQSRLAIETEVDEMEQMDIYTESFSIDEAIEEQNDLIDFPAPRRTSLDQMHDNQPESSGSFSSRRRLSLDAYILNEMDEMDLQYDINFDMQRVVSSFDESLVIERPTQTTSSQQPFRKLRGASS